MIDTPETGFVVGGRRFFSGHLINPLDVQMFEVHGVPRLALKSADNGRWTLANGVEVTAVKHDNREIGVGHDPVGVAPGFATNNAGCDDYDHIALP